jgi:hypothetical protein
LVLDQVVDLFCSDLAGTGAEATVEGQNVYGDVKGSHVSILESIDLGIISSSVS